MYPLFVTRVTVELPIWSLPEVEESPKYSANWQILINLVAKSSGSGLLGSDCANCSPILANHPSRWYVSPAFCHIFSPLNQTLHFHFLTLSNNFPSIHFLVADALTQNSPRLIDDTKAKKLAADLKRCPYFETCAMYGLNVERVFQDGECYFHL